MEGPYTRDPSGDTPSAPDSEIAPSGQIYVAASDGSSLLLAADGKIEAYYRIAHSPTISPNGTRVAYSMLHDSTYGEAVFPYGSYLIETSNFDGSDRRRLTEGDVMDFSPTWSPEGSRIAFVRRKDRGGCDNFRQVGIHTIGDNGQDIRKVVDIPARNAEGTPTEWDAWYHSGPTWSSDGELLAYIVNEREESEDKRPGYFRDYARIHTTLYTVNADRSDLKRLLTFSSRGYLMPLDQQYVTPDEDLKRVGLFSEEPGRSIVSPPEWSPDGQHIAFVGIAEGVPKLYTIGRDGSDLHEIVELENPGIGGPEVTRTSPSVFWSRDGSQILFSWGRTLYFVNADGSDLNSIHGGDYFSPSPDGSRVAHFVDGAKVVLLFAMAPDGSGVRALARRGKDFVLEAVGPELRPSADVPSCSAGVIVPDPEANPGLVRDCETLVEIVGRIAVAGLNWDPDTPIAEWEGVSLDGSDLDGETTQGSGESLSPLRVRGLSLPGHGLIGPFPVKVTELSELQELDLSSNMLSGAISSELGRLTSLRILKLNYNTLSGSILGEIVKGVDKTYQWGGAKVYHQRGHWPA